MPEELKQAAQAALDQLEFLNACYPHKTATDAADALRRALAQRPAAQAGEDGACGVMPLIEDYAKAVHDGDDALCQVLRRTIEASLPTQPAAQATPDQFADASKMVAPVALRSVHLTRDMAGMCVVRINGRVAIRDNGDLIDHMATLEWFADTQQATPEPLIVKGAMTGMVDAQVRDLWPTKKEQATPGPAGEVRCEGCGYMTHHREHMGCVRAAKQYTHPAPGVPESPCQLRKRFEQHMRDVFACKDTAFLSIDGGKTYLDGGMDNHWRTWLAARAKGAGHE